MALLLREIRRPRVLLLPMPAGGFAARSEPYFLEFLPDPPLTRDQIKLLLIDNVAAADMPGLNASRGRGDRDGAGAADLSRSL